MNPTGKERDAETGPDFFGSRSFSFVQGRFTRFDATIMKKKSLADLRAKYNAGASSWSPTI
jgi:hypothetical protein